MTRHGVRFLRIAFGALLALCIAGTTGPAFADPINVTGAKEDVDAFNAMIKACRGKSKAFDKLISDIEKDKTRGGKVNISVGHSGAYVDNANGGMGHTDVNLDNLGVFPDPDVDDKGKIKAMPKGVPPWATTRCEIMAHFIAEAHSTASTASTDIAGGHKVGITCQNEVRTGFGQTLACASSINHYDLKDKNKLLYTQISYGIGGAANMKLRFAKDGSMVIDYYSDGNKEYVPPKEPVKPAPPKTANNKAPANNGKANGGISFDNPDDFLADVPRDPDDCVADLRCIAQTERLDDYGKGEPQQPGRGSTPSYGPTIGPAPPYGDVGQTPGGIPGMGFPGRF